MANMFNKNSWKEPIYKNDLINVILNGLIAGIFGGLLAGAIDYLFIMLNSYITFGLVILAYLVGWRISKGYYSFHVLYPIISIACLTLGLAFSFAMELLLSVQFNFQAFFQFLGTYVLSGFYMPFANPFIFIINGNIISFLLSVISLACYVIAYIICYKVASKGR